MSSRIPSIERRLEQLLGVASSLQAPLLASIRLYWGYQLVLTGMGKLGNVERVAAWFAELGIPAPTLNVYMAGGTELVGGALLIVGLGSRAAALAVLFTMCVAYLTSDREALLSIWADSDAFVTAAPFLFLFASAIVLAFGPGILSLDHLVKRARERRAQARSKA